MKRYKSIYSEDRNISIVTAKGNIKPQIVMAFSREQNSRMNAILDADSKNKFKNLKGYDPIPVVVKYKGVSFIIQNINNSFRLGAFGQITSSQQQILTSVDIDDLLDDLTYQV